MAGTIAPMTEPDYSATAQWWRKAISVSGKQRLSAMVNACLHLGQTDFFQGIDFDIGVDKVVFEYRIPNGRVDVAVFHADGSLTLIEMKDGSTGITSVLCGIGQVTMYGLTAGMSAGRPRDIRKALLWDSTGDVGQDVLIGLCCEQAGVIPMQFGPMEPQIEASRRALATLDQMEHTSDK
jgi:hypothetical protein